MTLPARFALLHSDLNDFLFASLGDEENGMPLNVVSALTRLGIDPWEEAARLAALPKALAAEALAPMIARLPIRQTLPSDTVAVSHQLVALLPNARASRPADAEAADRKSDKRYSRILLLLACFALGMVVLTAIL
jgi:hypothetical protein